MRRGRRQPGQRRHLLLGDARAPGGRARLRLARPTGRPAARGRHRASTSPPRTASPPPWLTRRPPRDPARDGGRRRCWPGRRARRTGARAPRCTASTRCAMTRRSPSATATTRRSRCGTSTTSSAATSRTATATTRAAAFRRWLEARYGTVDALNDAWGTAFWSQRYGDVRRGPAAAAAPTSQPGPAARLRAVLSDALLEHYRAEARRPPRAHPGRPVTTNLMVCTRTKWMDYCAWARDLDVVANDHYPDRRPTRGPRRARLQRGPHARRRRRRARGCSWSTRRAP